MESRNEPTCRAAVETDMENRLVDMEGEGEPSKLGNSQCKGPGVRPHLVCLRNSKEASVPGWSE